MPSWPQGDPRDVVRGVLADPRFRAAAQRPGEKTWLDYAAEALRRFWDWVMQPLRHVAGGRTIANAIGIVVLIAIAILVVFAIVRFVRRRGSARRPRRSAQIATLAAERDSRALLDAARAAAAAGRYREAAVLLWSSALRALDERGRVRYDAARSPGEWRRAVQDPDFDRLARDAVLALFAERDVDAALVARMRAAYDGMLAAP